MGPLWAEVISQTMELSQPHAHLPHAGFPLEQDAGTGRGSEGRDVYVETDGQREREPGWG